jgi:hypothetical protein
MTTNELYHYGILGQKWGIRRYQYPDGSLTPAGRKRYAGGVSTNSHAPVNSYRSYNDKPIPSNQNKSNNNDEVDLKIANQMSNETNNFLNSMSNLARRVDKKKNKSKDQLDEEVKAMSNEELQKRVNRMNLERAYKNLETDKIEKGRSHAVDVIDTIKDVTVGVTSAATLGTLIYKLIKGVL